MNRYDWIDNKLINLPEIKPEIVLHHSTAQTYNMEGVRVPWSEMNFRRYDVIERTQRRMGMTDEQIDESRRNAPEIDLNSILNPLSGNSNE